MKKRIQQIIKNGKKIETEYFILYSCLSFPFCKIGFIVGKKIGKSTYRNYIKRVIRNLWKQKVKKGNFIFILKETISEIPKEKIFIQLKKILDEIKCQNY